MDNVDYVILAVLIVAILAFIGVLVFNHMQNTVLDEDEEGTPLKQYMEEGLSKCKCRGCEMHKRGGGYQSCVNNVKTGGIVPPEEE